MQVGWKSGRASMVERETIRERAMLRIESSKKVKAKKQAGFVVTAELLLITTILGLGLITGFTKVRDQVLAELSDTGSAIGAINQSY